MLQHEPKDLRGFITVRKSVSKDDSQTYRGCSMSPWSDVYGKS